MKTLWAYLKDENGQTSIEYILMLAVAALIVFKFKEEATTRIKTLTETIFTKAQEGIGAELDSI